MKFFPTLIAGSLILISCADQSGNQTLFQRLSPEETGIDFRNDLKFDKEFNIFTYRNFYNGGGVGAGDINNDGLVDLYFTSNQGQNKLYLNKGNFRFEDITSKAGVAGKRAWSTGVAMADINGDGLLDIYVCNSGDVKGDNKQNELFINNGDLTFTEQAEEYGMADQGYSTHAVFFDYDKDGDLDVYLLNNSYQAIGSFNLMQNIRHVRDSVGGDKLFRNENGHFTDVSEQAGIYGSIIGFGLGITIGDVNNDTWPDIFISNDFFERDYLYINNHDGTFTERLESSMPSVSAASMGADIADINNDGWLDIFVTDMLPEDDYRLKQITTFENWDKFNYNFKNGYHYQLTRNMLHLNNGNGTFSDIGRLAGVSATDWSWGALIFDADNDGYKDIFVANGIYQDITDLDYLTYIADANTVKEMISKQGVNYESLIKPIPINPVPNYLFRNQHNLKFENKAAAWGLAEPVHSNGSAYADLDNDGALDLIVNNVNREAFIYRNTLRKQSPETSNYLKFKLKGTDKNTAAVGTRILIKAGNERYLYEQMPNRGFQSSIDPVITAGVGTNTQIDEIEIIWPDNRITRLKNVKVNQQLDLNQQEGEQEHENTLAETNPWLMEISERNLIDFTHRENSFIDFDRDRLTYHMISTLGPKLAEADVNGDGLIDVFVCGAKDQAGQLFIKQASGIFIKQNEKVFEEDASSEDVDVEFLDLENDGDPDLFVASGGNEFSVGAPQLIDRLYLNDGKGHFTKSQQAALTSHIDVSATVSIADFDKDGFIDVFVGNRVKPFLYGLPAGGYLYKNDGKGNLIDATPTLAPELKALGMISDATWIDYDQDGDVDLFVVGEWMTIELFRNENGSLKRYTETAGLDQYTGWWNVIHPVDLDQDGDMDLVLGNHGENSRFKASPESPLTLYVNDFDKNGSIEHILAHSINGKDYPYTLRHDLIAQLPALKKKYLKYESYNKASVNDIFSEGELKNATVWRATHMQSSVLINNGSNSFSLEPLPVEAQISPVYAISSGDLNNDGIVDLILGGNLYEAKPEAGRYDTSYGLVLQGNGNSTFKPLNAHESGFSVRGAIRDIQIINHNKERLVIIALNNEHVRIFRSNQ